MKLRAFGTILGTITTGVALCLFSLSAAAVPISGKMEFAASGCFTKVGGACAGGGDTLDGFNFSDGPGPGGNFESPMTYSDGDISTILGLTPGLLLPVGSGPALGVFDFSLSAVPAVEWAIPTIVDGVAHILGFFITSGGETDVNSDGILDLAGQGFLELICLGDALTCGEVAPSYEMTEASWSLSNTGGLSIVGIVPEPATLGILGLGLLGWGVARRRSIKAA